MADARPRPPLERDRVAIELGLAPPYAGYEHPRWKRSRRGDTIHHYDCPRAAPSALAWFWPEDEGIGADADLMVRIPTWLRPCRVCFHPEDIATLEALRAARIAEVIMEYLNRQVAAAKGENGDG